MFGGEKKGQNIGEGITEAFLCVQEDSDSRRENQILLPLIKLLTVGVVRQEEKNKALIFYLKSKASLEQNRHNKRTFLSSSTSLFDTTSRCL